MATKSPERGSDPTQHRYLRATDPEGYRSTGLTYDGAGEYVLYQRPAAHDVKVCLDTNWIVLCLGPSRSSVTIASDRPRVEEAFGPSITLMPAGCEIGVREDPGWTSEVVLLFPHSETLDESMDHVGLKQSQIRYFWAPESWAEKKARSLRSALLGGELYAYEPLLIESLMEQTVACLMDLYASRCSTGCIPRKRGLSRHQVTRIIDLVQGNIDQTITLDQLAKEVNLSRHHFARQFRVTTNASAYEFILARRLDQVMNMLAETKTTIAEIAAACGFFDQAHMAMHFRKRLGITPSSYRLIIRS